MRSVSLPRQVDFEKMAQSRAHLLGSMDLCDFSRLRQNLASDEGEVRVDLHFSKGTEGKSQCIGEVVLGCWLQCQRCLQTYQYTLTAQIGLTPVVEDSEAESITNGLEPIITRGEPVNLVEMIEDELLLIMPLIPRHETENCDGAQLNEETLHNKLELALTEWKTKLKPLI